MYQASAQGLLKVMLLINSSAYVFDRVCASVLVVWMAELIETAEKLPHYMHTFFCLPLVSLRPLLAEKRERA